MIARAIAASLLAALVAAAALPADAAEHGAPAKKGEAKGEGAPAGPVFVKLQPLVVPIIDDKNKKVSKTAGVLVALELFDGKSEADLEPTGRKLRDAMLRELYDYVDEQSGGERVLDLKVVKKRLQATCDEVLGKGMVRDVLVQQAFEKRTK